MTPTLYGPSHSRAFRVEWLLRELQVDHEQVPVDFFRGETMAPGFLAINPNGRVPAWQDDKGIFWESLSINLYLAKRHSPGNLGPIDVVEDARMTQWSIWSVTEIEKPLLVLLANRHLFVPADRDATEEGLALTKLQRPLAALESALVDKVALVGGRFSVADLNVASVLMLGKLAELNLSGFPAVQGWMESCCSRSAAAGYEVMRLPAGPRPPQWRLLTM